MTNDQTLISKRLAAIIPNKRTEVKLNGEIYYAGFCMLDFYINESQKDFTLQFSLCDDFNNFCFNKANKITCWPTSKGAQPVTDKGQWTKEGRMEMKPGKFLLLFTNYIKCRNEYNVTIDDSSLRAKIIARLCEIFTDTIRGSNEDIVFDITKNISEIYAISAHDSSGYLKNSCMQDDGDYGCREYANFYNKIPQLKIVYKKTPDNYLLFRALLWENIKTNDDKTITFLDRVYGSDCVNHQLMEYAKEHGWAYRNFNSNYIHFMDNDSIQLQCPIPNDAYDYLKDEGSPYVDTLHRLSSHSNKWILSNYISSPFSLQECDGRAVRDSESCAECNDDIPPGDVYRHNDNSYCNHCFHDLFSYCERCGEYYPNDEVHSVPNGSMYCETCLDRYGYSRCERCDDWIVDAIIQDDCHWCPTCFERVFAKCSICDQFYRKDNRNDRLVTVDGEPTHVCIECLDDSNNLVQCNKCECYFTDFDMINKDGLCDICVDTIKDNKAVMECIVNSINHM
jgi:hypothetical protein